jgi:hypothetical protein
MKTRITMGALLALLAGCGASPEDVCSHIEGIVTKEAGADAAKEAIDGCEFTWKMRKDTKGLLQYKELADCVTDSENVEQLARCK